MSDVKVIKYNTGSPTDVTIMNLQKRLQASSNTEVLRRAISIADFLTSAKEKGQQILIRDANGNTQELLIS